MKKFKEIGSSFWLKPDELDMQKNADIDLVFVRQGEQVVYSSSGRGAISLILSQFGSRGGRAFLPSYTCGSVLAPFLAKEYSLFFYGVRKDLTIDQNAFLKGIEEHDPDVILLHAYFGFDTIGNVREFFPQIRAKGKVIIEDITHSMFSEFPKHGSDYHISSIRKWYALPDGGAAISLSGRMTVPESEEHGELVKVNTKAGLMKYEYTRNLNPKVKEEYRKLFYETDDMLDRDCAFYPMSGLSRTLISNVDFAGLRTARRRNFKYLLENLNSFHQITPIFERLPEDVVPLYFPLIVSSGRDDLRAFLAEAEIYAPVHWPIPESVVPVLSKTVKKIYDSILSIPCDQRYGIKDMERIVQRLASFNS